MKEENKPYDLNLARFKNHKKTFPWMFVIRIIVGVGMAAFIYYMTMKLLTERPRPPAQEIDATEIEISTD